MAELLVAISLVRTLRKVILPKIAHGEILIVHGCVSAVMLCSRRLDRWGKEEQGDNMSCEVVCCELDIHSFLLRDVHSTNSQPPRQCGRQVLTSTLALAFLSQSFYLRFQSVTSLSDSVCANIFSFVHLTLDLFADLDTIFFESQSCCHSCILYVCSSTAATPCSLALPL